MGLGSELGLELGLGLELELGVGLGLGRVVRRRLGRRQAEPPQPAE